MRSQGSRWRRFLDWRNTGAIVWPGAPLVPRKVRSHLYALHVRTPTFKVNLLLSCNSILFWIQSLNCIYCMISSIFTILHHLSLIFRWYFHFIDISISEAQVCFHIFMCNESLICHIFLMSQILLVQLADFYRKE